MDKLIKKLEVDPFSNFDILNICDQNTKVIRYSELKKYSNIDDVLKPFDNVVILYESKKNYGHWVCLLKYDKIIEFFDPYGLPIDTQLKYSKDKVPLLSKLLVDSPYLLAENRTKLQKLYKDVSTCGRHVCVRIILKDLPLKEYINIMVNNKIDPDLIVTYLTSFIK